MKQIRAKILSGISMIVLFSGLSISYAQGFGRPLQMQGIDAFTNASASSRATGGLLFGSGNDIDLMFSNPVSLRSLQGIVISAGGRSSSFDAAQTQQYAPLEYYSNFSLFMEGLTRYIGDPVYDTSVTTYTAADTVQRPFDDLGPNWNRSGTRSAPMNIFVGAPMEIGDVKFSIGLGAAEYADLHWYYQNNNVLSPSILTPNPFVASRPANDADSSSIPVQWYQSIQQRTGSIQGYGAALAFSISDKFDLGISGMFLNGSSDDRESRIERGRIRMYQNYFRAESVYFRVVKNGSSEYEGTEITLSGSYRGKFVTAGAVIKLPSTITRTFTGTVLTDTAASAVTRSVKETDEITLPLRGTLALSILVRENLRFGLEYEFRPFASSEYTSPGGSRSKPWLSADVVHVGMEFIPLEWMVVRAGVRQHAEIYESVGNPLAGEPVGYTVYSAGAGFKFSSTAFNLTYEYSRMKFVDMWADAVSINTDRSHTIIAGISYTLPWNH